jgi:hypothetical protein
MSVTGDRGTTANGTFLVAVMAALALAAAAGALSEPPDRVPSYALGSPLVYRLEVGAAFFLTLYTVTVLVRLASQGLTPSRVGTTAVHLPQMADTVGAVREELEAGRMVIDDMLGTIADHGTRIVDLERSIMDTGKGTRSNDGTNH